MGSDVTTTVKTSIRLALASLAVCAITFAASGAPLPFTTDAHRQFAVVEAPLPLSTPDTTTHDTQASTPIRPGQFNLN